MTETAAAPAPQLLAWVDAALRGAVARVAATDPDPTDPFRGLYISDASAMETATALDGMRLDDRVRRLADAAGLTGELDVALLALCAAPDLDARYGRLIAYLHDDVARRRASPRLLATLLGEQGVGEDVVLGRLAADAPLRALGIVCVLEAEPQVPVADRMLALDDTAVAILLGADLAPPAGDGIGLVPRRLPPPQRAALVGRLRRLLSVPAGGWLAVTGPDAEQVLAHAAACDLVTVDVEAALDPVVAARARLLGALGGRAVVIQVTRGPDAATAARLRGLTATGSGVLIAPSARDLAGAVSESVRIHAVPPLTAEERRDVWAAALPAADTAATSRRFGLTHAQILAAAGTVSQGDRVPSAEEVADAARDVAGASLGPLATRLAPAAGWSDLILPPAQTAVLRSIAAFVVHRERVEGEWGFGALPAAPRGLSAMFAGPSGTGKTLAARVLAEELGLEAYRIDLSAIVSKYIGETEKQLDQVFQTADQAGALLIFDEADALFGKRSAVTDARDRYANLEVAFLLQRLESHDGVVILTTNLRQNLDAAFLRRLDFAIDFPTPGAEQRLALWRRHLPAAAPLDDDVHLEALAASYDLSGGSIATCARLAAFAAAAGGRITMRHLTDAVDLELQKHGRLPADRRRASI